MKRPVEVEALELKIAQLSDLCFADLQRRYMALHGMAAPKRIGRKLLILAIAYEMQRKAYCVRVDRLRARALATKHDTVVKKRTSRSGLRKSMRPGGRLVREWRGRSFEIYVADDGCYLDGKRYGSLSAAAEAITGVKRNGPAFFGLRSARRGE